MNADGGIHELPLPSPARGRLWLCGEHAIGPDPEGHGRRVIMHCAAGIGRAGTTAVAVLVSLAVPFDEALERVRRHRPIAGPEVGAQLELVQELHELLSVTDGR